jgi:hypothetical protein
LHLEGRGGGIFPIICELPSNGVWNIMGKVHVLKEAPKIDKFFNVRHPKFVRDLDLIDPEVVMESLPNIAILLLRQFKDIHMGKVRQAKERSKTSFFLHFQY